VGLVSCHFGRILSPFEPFVGVVRRWRTNALSDGWDLRNILPRPAMFCSQVMCNSDIFVVGFRGPFIKITWFWAIVFPVPGMLLYLASS